MTDYEFWLDDNLGYRLMSIEAVAKCDISKLPRGIGYAVLKIPGHYTPLRVDQIFECWRAGDDLKMVPEAIAFIRRVVYETDSDGRETTTLAGPGVKDLLRRRIVAAYAQSAGARKTDNADNMAKDIVRESMGAGAIAARDLTAAGLAVQSHLSLAPTVQQSFAWRNVWSALTEIANSSATAGTPLYYDIEPIVTADNRLTFEFRTYINQRGRDRRSGEWIILAPEFGTLENPRLIYDYENEANYIYSGGAGDADSRVVRELYDSARIGTSPWNRQERFFDSRQEEQDVNAIDDRGEAELRDARPRVRFSALVRDRAGCRYGSEWGYGDRIPVSYAGLDFDCEIAAVTIELDENGDEKITGVLEAEL